ncbi:hypothetical protein L218DRAFT_1067629 [Marasmius fiardii PR-910]|nr:hypothetical protein L218DRAFT_1067629 [Marasmius fiardii PR-910]
MTFGLWKGFSPSQFKNMMIYIVYKLALEWYNGAVIAFVQERWEFKRYQNIGILTALGLNYAMQCVGSIIVAPLIKKYRTRSVLSTAVLIFGLISAILLIVDGATGGIPRFRAADKKLFPIYIISGVSYGTVELIRRVIPRDIVGGDVQLLRRMDATVHILYEVAGTIGAFTSVSLISKFGYNYGSLLSPVFFTLAAIIWRFVEEDKIPQELQSLRDFEQETNNPRYIPTIRIVLLHSLPKQYLVTHLKILIAWSQIIVGGSNLGELLGALSVLLTTNYISTPLPWLRLDALALNIVWVLPFIAVQPGKVREAWRVGAIYGWAAGDVSLAAYIQATLARIESSDKSASALGAVMAFLYVFYIILYAILDTVLGRWADSHVDGKDPNSPESRNVLKYIGGAQFTVLCVIILCSTFIPKGSFSLNPNLDDFNESGDSDDSDDDTSSEAGQNNKELIHATI